MADEKTAAPSQESGAEFRERIDSVIAESEAVDKNPYGLKDNDLAPVDDIPVPDLPPARTENVSDTLEDGVCRNYKCSIFGRSLTDGVCSKCGYTAERSL